MMIFEEEVIKYLSVPSIPKKEWDGKSSFDKGVAVVELYGGVEACAIARFNAEKDAKPVIVKVFGTEPFSGIKRIYVVPDYMATAEDIANMDLDEQSMKKAASLLSEAKELEGEEDKVVLPKNEYFFGTIKNDDEARAFIQSYNSRHRIKGRIPTTHEGLVMRLSVIYAEQQKQNK